MARLFKTALALAAGAGLAYLLDPDRGHARRARLKDQLAARARDAGDEVRRRAEYEAGRMKGVVHDIAAEGTDVPIDDQELMQKIKSEAVGPSAVDAGQVEVIVEGGHVTLRGTADPHAVQDLIDRVAAVTGVHRIQNEITPA